jgi:hypothetical protein
MLKKKKESKPSTVAYTHNSPLRRLRKEDLKFKASLCYTVRPCLKLTQIVFGIPKTIIYLFCSAGDRTHGLVHARQASCLSAITPALRPCLKKGGDGGKMHLNSSETISTFLSPCSLYTCNI